MSKDVITAEVHNFELWTTDGSTVYSVPEFKAPTSSVGPNALPAGTLRQCILHKDADILHNQHPVGDSQKVPTSNIHGIIS